MSKRNDITDGIFATTKKYGLVYTEELGWIDLGHAQGQDARILKRKLEQEHFSTYYDEFHDWYFPVDYHQEMGIRKKIFRSRSYISYRCLYEGYGSFMSFTHS
ncbi:hypothetical protein [Escherichia coli]